MYAPYSAFRQENQNTKRYYAPRPPVKAGGPFRIPAGRVKILQAGGAVLSVTVVPADHLEWQPPHMMAVTVSSSPLFTDRMREPESSIGAKLAPQTPQRCSSSDRVRFRAMVRLGMAPIVAGSSDTVAVIRGRCSLLSRGKP